MMDDTLMSFPPDRLPLHQIAFDSLLRHSAAPFGIQIAMNQFAIQLHRSLFRMFLSLIYAMLI